MNIAHSIGGLAYYAGGTSTYVVELASAQCVLPEFNVRALSFTPPEEIAGLDPAVTLEVMKRPKELHAHLDQVDLLHSHGLWLGVNHEAARAARRGDMPLVVSLHGMLEPGALKFSRWKKRLAWWLYQRRDLLAADCLHATAMDEAENLRAMGLKQPIIISPPGVRLPPLPEVAAGEDRSCRGREQNLEREHSLSAILHPPSKKRTALFLSRVHPKKNLTVLLKVWAKLRPKDWRLVIAGPDEGGHSKELQKQAADLGLQDVVEFTGPVWGEAKDALYRQADLFVLPSLSENFGIVVPEALAYEIPVLTTTPTPWRELSERGCGWWVDPIEADLAAALEDATRATPERLEAMGRRGRTLVEEKYQWPAIAEEMLTAYRWVLGEGQKPDCVF